MKKQLIAAFCSFALLGLMIFTPSAASASGEPRTSAPITPGIYEIAAASDPGFVLDVETCTLEEKESREIQIFRSLDVNQQKFYVEQLPGGGCRISALRSGKALTADPADVNENSGNELPDTANVYLEELQRSPGAAAQENQTWYLESAGDGTYYIVSALDTGTSADADPQVSTRASGYLTRQGKTLCNGADLILSGFTGEKNQKWVLKKTWISSQDTADTDFFNPYESWGPYENVRILMRFGDEKEVLTSKELAAWVLEENHSQELDPDAVLAYVQNLADKYDTQGYARKFMTSYGKEITLYKGNFGWKLDVDGTARAITEAASFHRQQFVDPIWSHEGVGFTRGDDIGDSYVEVDLVNQKVWLYKDGEQLLKTDCVSGTYGTERQTPGGVYSITYMQSPAVLRGVGYESPVTYWMPFNGGIGLHDANWRSSFGGDIYKSNGSHGCINLPTEAAKLIYETVSVGYPVVCYN